MSDQVDFTKNILPFLSQLEEDEAGYDPAEISRRYGISEECIAMLSRNENPYGPSPRLRAAIKDVSLNRYPNSQPFLKALTTYTGYPEEHLVAGAGMDEIITTICRIFLGKGDSALIPVPTYNFYGVAAELCGARPHYQARLSGFAVDTKIPDGTKMVFLCSPNNPTGNALSEENVRAVVEGTEAIVFLDEAYAEFAKKSLLKLVSEYDNLVVGRTLSKAFGLAGLRLGYAVAPPWIAQQYRRVAPLFSISTPSLAAGVSALRDLDWMRECVGKIVSERERMRERLACANPSEGNFLYVQTRKKSEVVVERLLCRGIMVRDCNSFPGCGEKCLRVTVGRPEENDRFLEEFEKADTTSSS
ncbi:MAG: histidinol-phosphate transaminase [Methanothrix sp.]|nr:histidinol-phosphate transaminase [Methanothrix sp.]